MASIAKFNHDELPIVASLLGLESANEELAARKVLLAYALELVCITRGAKGSLLVSRAESSDHSGIVVQVVDAVGAGDAFTAGLVHGFLQGAS